MTGITADIALRRAAPALLAPPAGGEMARLRAENDELRHRLAVFERDFPGEAFHVPLEWRLSAQEARAFLVLLARPQVSGEQLLVAMHRYGARETSSNLVAIYIGKLRRKLLRHDVVIQTIWGQGYAIPEPRRAALRARLARPA